jgi:hypothetical protein
LNVGPGRRIEAGLDEGSDLSAVALDLERTHDWVAVNSYRVRVAAFALIGIPIALHVLPRSPGALFWTLSCCSSRSIRT